MYWKKGWAQVELDYERKQIKLLSVDIQGMPMAREEVACLKRSGWDVVKT